MTVPHLILQDVQRLATRHPETVFALAWTVPDHWIVVDLGRERIPHGVTVVAFAGRVEDRFWIIERSALRKGDLIPLDSWCGAAEAPRTGAHITWQNMGRYHEPRTTVPVSHHHQRSHVRWDV